MRLPLIQSLKKSAIYFTAWLMFCLFAMAWLSSHSTVQCFINLNTFHSGWMDRLFMLVTFMGDGIFLLIVAAILLIARQYELALKAVMAFLLSGILVQVLKNSITAPRPRVLLESLGLSYQYFIDGITRIGNSSFPSGHTTTFFALATLLAMQTNNAWKQLLLLLAALLVGYSRIYLGQHFLQDVVTGSVIGVCTAIPIHFFKAQKIAFRKHSNKAPYAIQ
jgi:membrane-associated phospholipid phosphatase